MTLGLMTAPRWKERFNAGEYIRIVVDGECVTSHCASADDRAGWALVEEGIYGERSYRLVTGHVEFIVISLARPKGFPA